MKHSGVLLSSIVTLFAMLWLPLGQYDFLMDHWMKIGTYAIPFVLIGAFSFIQEMKNEKVLADFRFIGILMLIAYIVHQFEEHWVDLYGNNYAFYTFNNNFILGNLGQPNSEVKPLTKEAVFVINTSLVWLVGALAILRSPKHLFPLVAMGSIIIVNAVVHILAGLATFQYNPGILTSIIVFVPIYFWFIKYYSSQIMDSKKQILGGIVWAVLAHIIMVGGLLMANWFGVISEFSYFVALVIWSLLPLLLFRNHQQASH